MPAAIQGSQPDLETWKNVTAGTVALKRLDHRGDFTKEEILTAGKATHITSAERRMNSEQAANEELDFFRNGILSPIRLIDGSEDAREIASNPNMLSESDMHALLKAPMRTFESRASELNRTAVLERLLAMAHEDDATIKKVEFLKARLQAVNPSGFTENTTQVAGQTQTTGIRPVTPK